MLIHCKASFKGDVRFNELFLLSVFADFAMANVTCEYDVGDGPNDDESDVNNTSSASGNNGEPGRRIRRSETLLRQAAECVSRGQTFQTVSDMFHIPISTIRQENVQLSISKKNQSQLHKVE